MIKYQIYDDSTKFSETKSLIDITIHLFSSLLYIALILILMHCSHNNKSN